MAVSMFFYSNKRRRNAPCVCLRARIAALAPSSYCGVHALSAVMAQGVAVLGAQVQVIVPALVEPDPPLLGQRRAAHGGPHAVDAASRASVREVDAVRAPDVLEEERVEQEPRQQDAN